MLLRINTNGLVANASSIAIAQRLKSCGISAAGIALNAPNPKQYAAIMNPSDLGFAEVCGFITNCVDAGIVVTASCVQRPDVDTRACEALAVALGAHFKLRSWHP